MEQPVVEKLDKLKEALVLMAKEPIKDLSQLTRMSDKDFEQVRGNLLSFAYLRYAMRKKELGLETKELFTKIKGREPQGTELKGFARDIRVGEFLLKLTQGFNDKVSSTGLASLLEQPLALENMATLNTLPYWVICVPSSSTLERFVNQTMLAIHGVPTKIWQILDEKRVSLKRLSNPSTPNPKPSKIARK